VHLTSNRITRLPLRFSPSWLLALVLFVAPVVTIAQENPPDPAAAALAEWKAAEKPDADLLARILPFLADPAQRAKLRNEILLHDPFPAAALIANLKNPALAIRLAALEMLEEKAGGDLDFNPWLPPADPANDPALARWNQWAASADPASPGGPLINEDQRRGYLRDLLGDDADKATRARHMLGVDGLASVGFLETFLSSTPTLPAGSRAKVRQAQYQIVLNRAFGEQASDHARQLTFGTRDQMLASLAALRSAGLAGLPILRDFLDHPDPLVRESAIDAMLAAGGSAAVPIVAPVLKKETDVNVIHGALRRLKDVSGKESTELAVSFLKHEDEDLLVSAIQTCLRLVGGAQDSFYFDSSDKLEAAEGIVGEVNQAIVTLLDDPRWRVRTAALEFIAGRRVIEGKEKSVALLGDPDEFVRFRAIKACAVLKATEALPKLKEMFLQSPDMVGPVLEGYAAFSRIPDAEMLAALTKYPADARLAVVRAAEQSSGLQEIVLSFASDPDIDVACAALRYLGADADRVESPRVASALFKALEEGSPEKLSAVTDRLQLPKIPAIDPAVTAALGDLNVETGPTTLDPLYDAFRTSDSSAPETPALPDALGKLSAKLLEIAAGDNDTAFRCRVALSAAGHPEALRLLLTSLPTASTAHKSAIAAALSEPTRREAVPILRELLRDPVAEIRSAAAAAAFSNQNAAAFISLVLEELMRDGSPLLAHELCSWEFNSACSSGASSRIIRNWATKVGVDDEARTDIRILALIALNESFPTSATGPVLALAKGSSDPWLRRAAWFTLGSKRMTAIRGELQALADDPSPQVRAVLPEITTTANSSWEHRFDDTHGHSSSSWDSERRNRRIDDPTAALLTRMAESDPSPTNRFEAAFTLLCHGREIDVEAFASLIPRQPEKANVSWRITYWLRENIRRLGPGLAPILSAINTEGLDPALIKAIAAPKDNKDGFASFSALVASDEAARNEDLVTVAPDEETADNGESTRESLKLIYFLKPGCQDCAKVSAMLADFKRDFPLLAIEEHNILEGPSTLLNQALCDRFSVPSNQQNIAPSVFTQTGFLVRENIQPQALGNLLDGTMRVAQDDAWSSIGEQDLSKAREEVEDRYDSLTLPIVIGAGLLDGVNPCAFATIIFFLSYLQIARRSPREMLMVGAAFILAIFLTYLAAGLALHRVLAAITTQVQGIQKWLNWIFGSLALLAAILSLRDAILAHRGRAGDMTLQLPGFLKDRIRGAIRTGARSRRFVIAAFIVGVVVSFLELACTGQVYAPIIYQIQQGRADAFGMLIIYNLAFILPLVIIFILAWAGLRSEALIRFQKKSTATIKILLALLFLALAAFMFFGTDWLKG
jgi:cytochrome c biogenesis protein CcdA/HEAT repeat protein